LFYKNSFFIFELLIHHKYERCKHLKNIFQNCHGLPQNFIIADFYQKNNVNLYNLIIDKEKN